MNRTIFELIDTIQKGNKKQVMDIVNIFQGQIDSYSKKANSEDIKQDLYIFLLTLIDTITLNKLHNTSDKILIAYISRNIKFKFYKYFKQKYTISNTELTFFDEINYDELFSKNSISDDIIFSDLIFFNLLKNLTAKEKNFIIQKYKHGFTISEIAKKNKVSVQSIYKLEKRALTKLKNILK